jgi:hypothetical protein
MTFIVDPVNRVPRRWSRANGFQKTLKGLQRWIDCDPPAAVASPTGVAWVGASLKHGPPTAILGGAFAAVLGMNLQLALSPQATTTLRLTTPQVAARNAAL